MTVGNQAMSGHNCDKLAHHLLNSPMLHRGERTLSSVDRPNGARTPRTTPWSSSIETGDRHAPEWSSSPECAPKHGSRLDMAVSELAVLSNQCLARRVPDRQTLEHEVEAWLKRRNTHNAKADWRFTTTDGRIKLKSLYSAL